MRKFLILGSAALALTMTNACTNKLAPQNAPTTTDAGPAVPPGVDPADVELTELPAMQADLIAKAAEHHEWEEFSRIRLMEGAPLQRYYPLHADAWPEYEEWRRQNGKG